MDLKIGVAFSRYQTQYFQGLLRKSQSGLRMITYGPCQTPTLGFCVDQAEKIKKFVPEPWWSMEAVTTEKGKAFQLKWCKSKIYERTIVTILHSRIASITSATVLNVDKSVAYKSKP